MKVIIFRGRFMKQNRLSWWYSPVGSSDNSTPAMEVEQVDGDGPQDIYEVVSESSRQSNPMRQNQSSGQKDDGPVDDERTDKKPHDYEVISEDFFLHQRRQRGRERVFFYVCVRE